MNARTHGAAGGAPPSDERGSAMLVSVLLIAALLALGTVFLATSLTDRKIASNQGDSAKAFGLAEAGLEDARSSLVSQDFSTLLAAGGHLFTNTSLGGGTYSVDVTNNVGTRFPTATIPLDAGGATSDADGYVVVTSTGQYRNAKRVLEVIVNKPTADFSYALWTSYKTTISSSGTVDSYNSAAGTYAATHDSNGDVFTNGTMNLSGSSMIDGDLELATAGPVSGGHVQPPGTTTYNKPTQTRPNKTCPGTYTPASSIVCGPHCTYDSGTGELKVSGDWATINAPPTTMYFSKLTLSGSSTLNVNTGGSHIDLYVATQLNISGGSLANSSAKPTDLTLLACGAATDGWTISGGSGAYFAVYAPTRKVTISGSGSLYGAVVANEVDDSGGSQIHYDKALGGGSIVNNVARTWREVVQ